MKRLFRLLFQLQGQRRRWAQSGFVFPTTVLLLLVVALTATALTYRAYSRSGQAILERQQQVITNATTPAIDRAKAKLDYLLTQDTRSPRKVPTSDQMVAMLQATVTDTGLEIVKEDSDIYTLPGETRLDINGDGTDDNAWSFTSDLNNDGNADANEVVAYSILIDDNNNDIDLNDDVSDAKAAALVTRNGPINTSEVSATCQTDGAETGQRSAEGWQISSGTTIEKNFQVNAFVANLNDASRTANTLEFQQVRSAARSNKWGAWFRYDLTVFPGPAFNWNGAMHTQGSLAPSGDFNAYMISSTRSCLYDESASEITLGAEDSDTGFKGQLVYGTVNGKAGKGNDGGVEIHVDNDGAEKPFDRAFKNNKDSIVGSITTAITDEILQDPVEVYLNDARKHVDDSTWTSEDINGDFDGRIRNVGAAELSSITLDDTFRADDRWGPKKVYDSEDPVDGQIPSGTSIGTNIGSNDKLTDEIAGLDGFWERQATSSGVRLIVGERLELGDANGWNSNPSGAPAMSDDAYDALYPPKGMEENTATDNGTFGYAEQKQRKALRDNLAAVQGMVVYRYDRSSGTTPQACIAVTAHPGTLQSRINSRTFRTRTDSSDVMTDFLTGNGTNGWEFEPVTSGMDTPLANLAKFAGDLKGGAPSFTPEQDSNVHPYPYMSMWGDYSPLRRVLDDGNNGSLADQTYEDSAACTLGLLAYNLTSIKEEYEDVAAADWEDLAAELIAAYTADPSLETEDYATWRDAEDAATSTKYVTNPTLVDIGGRYWAVERDRTYGFLTRLGLPAAKAPASFSDGEGTYNPEPASPNTSSFTVTTATTADTFPISTSYNVTCDPHIFADSGYGTSNDLDEALALALALCPKQAYYPSLYYLFPVEFHAQNGGETIPEGTYGEVTTIAGTATVNQPAEPYIDQMAAYSENNSFAAVDYTTVAAEPKAASGSGWELGTGTASASSAFTPTWGDGSDASLPDNDPFRVVVADDDGSFSSAFTVRAIDKGVYNGRENMALRFLDLDVGALATAGWIPGKDGSDIEHNGLVYAYREDAVREDEIVRPITTGATDAACNKFEVLKTYSTKSECYMTITGDALTSTDPPLAANNISLKPVDYAPDPDRRPYGFRLRNGATLNRGSEEQSGISFITDNSVVIQGDFNLHEVSSNLSEEFSDEQIFTLDPTSDGFFDDFYERETLDLDNFANSGKDSWRPAEILADAIYIHSNGFVDGFVEAAYAHNAAGALDDTFAYVPVRGSGILSYQSRNPFGQKDKDTKLLAERGDILREGQGDTDVPIYFDRNGVVYDTTTPANRLVEDDKPTTGDYIYWGFGNLEKGGNKKFNEFRKHYLPLASGETTVNALLISGIVPPREGQSYGGLHNFPRLAEFWSKTSGPGSAKEDLKIAGGFFQLFFSTSATAPFDLDAWEATDTSTVDEAPASYYNAPNRVWGYDVALQYSPQSPLASRFTSVGDPRSEFYRELPVEDPYIKMLRCAKYDGTTQIDPNASCS